MIVFEAAASPSVRPGEGLVGGRRIAGRILPYGSDGGTVPFRFDPVDRRFIFGKTDATVSVGPADPAAWEEVISRVPAGPVLVGPCSPAESVRGAYRAAATAAVSAGRPVYLLDPEPEGIPEGSGRTAVVLCSWRPGRAEAAFPGLAAAREMGLSAAALFPLLPGWTGETGEIGALARSARVGGAVSLTAVAPAMDGEGRRAIVEARAAADPAPAADGFFDLVHHGDWDRRLAERLAEVRATAVQHGLAALPPRPVGQGERAGNAAASARLEDLADRLETDEHRSALLYAGVRWIDESARDLAAILREGNFGRIFPFSGTVAAEAEAALREATAGR